VKALGHLVEEDRGEQQTPSARSIRKPEPIEMPSKKLWTRSARRADTPAFGESASGCVSSPKWKWGATVCSNRWTTRIPDEHQPRRVRHEPHRLGDHLQQHGGQHEAGAQRHEVAQHVVIPVPVADGYEGAAQEVRRGRDAHAQEREEEMVSAQGAALRSAKGRGAMRWADSGPRMALGQADGVAETGRRG